MKILTNATLESIKSDAYLQGKKDAHLQGKKVAGWEIGSDVIRAITSSYQGEELVFINFISGLLSNLSQDNVISFQQALDLTKYLSTISHESETLKKSLKKSKRHVKK